MKGVNRVVIAVEDVEKAGRLFGELLGVRFFDAGVVEGMGVRAMLSWEAGIELVSPVDPDGDVARFLRERGEGVYSVAFNVEDADAAEARARALGVGVGGTIEFGEAMGFAKFKEILLEPGDTHGVFTLLAEIEMKKR